jgi:hypothetical protein
MILSILRVTFIVALAKANCWNPKDERYPCWKGRGGSTMIAGTSELSSPVISEPHLPSMNLKHISLSLRYTCEMNRRLQEASHLKSSIHDRDYYSDDIPCNGSNPLQLSRGGQMVHIHPSQTWQPPIRESDEDDTEYLTLFHAKTPRQGISKVRRGVSRWGPDLELYMEHIAKALRVQDNPLVLSLSIIYLDRACSVETPRSNGAPACPYVSPRTVHRLVLVSLIIAAKAVYPAVDLTNIASLGISEQQLAQMENWMRLALGDQGLYVMPEQLQEFFVHWERTWNKPKIRIKSKKLRRNLVRPIRQHEQEQQLQQPLHQQIYQQCPAMNYAHAEFYPDPVTTSVSDAALSLWT